MEQDGKRLSILVLLGIDVFLTVLLTVLTSISLYSVHVENNNTTEVIREAVLVFIDILKSDQECTLIDVSGMFGSVDEALFYLRKDGVSDPLDCSTICSILKWIQRNHPERYDEALTSPAVEKCLHHHHESAF